jgi:hypothetical protein
VIQRISIVRRRPDISQDEFKSRWLGEHAEVASQLKGLKSYVLYFPTEECDAFDGLAVTTFDSREAAERAFGDPALADDLRRTREDFASSVEIAFVDEHVIVEEPQPEAPPGRTR